MATRAHTRTKFRLQVEVFLSPDQSVKISAGFIDRLRPGKASLLDPVYLDPKSMRLSSPSAQ